METFYNQERSGYEEIVSYGPQWWTQYREMDAVYQFAGWTLDLMASFLERLVNNQLPAYADEGTIAMLEKLLKLEHEGEMSLEERRTMVQAYYFGSGKLSESMIKKIVRSYTGCECNVWLEDDYFHIDIILDRPFTLFGSKVFGVIGNRMPAHLQHGFLLKDRIEAFLSVGCVVKEHKKIRGTQCAEENPLLAVNWVVDENGDMLTDESGDILIE